MADLTYKFTGVNTAQLANEVRILQQNSSTFRALDAAAVAAGYTTIEVQMGAGFFKDHGRFHEQSSARYWSNENACPDTRNLPCGSRFRSVQCDQRKDRLIRSCNAG